MQYNILEVSGFPRYKIFASLYKGVRNHREIRKLIASSKVDIDIDFAFLNADNVICLEQLYSALFRCFVDERNGDMKARSIHTEIISDMSPLRNIMEALSKFGIPSKGETSNMIVLKVIESSEPIEKDEVEKIATGLDILLENENTGGLYVTDANLEDTAKPRTIIKNYKLGNVSEEDKDKLIRLVVDTIQLRGL